MFECMLNAISVCTFREEMQEDLNGDFFTTYGPDDFDEIVHMDLSPGNSQSYPYSLSKEYYKLAWQSSSQGEIAST